MTDDRSCWSCGHRQKGTPTLLGHCWGWPDRPQDWPAELKATPARGGGFVVDKGCGRWQETAQDFEALKAAGREAAGSALQPQVAASNKEAPPEDKSRRASQYQPDLL